MSFLARQFTLLIVAFCGFGLLSAFVFVAAESEVVEETSSELFELEEIEAVNSRSRRHRRKKDAILVQHIPSLCPYRTTQHISASKSVEIVLDRTQFNGTGAYLLI